MQGSHDEWYAFATLAKELHFGRASKELFISQPALSRQIQKLEDKIGGPLFIRNRHHVVLTEAGRVLLPIAQKLLKDSSDAYSLARDAVKGRVGTLRIGFGTTAVAKTLPQAIRRFRRTNQRIALQLSWMPTPVQIASLLKGQIDIGLVRLPVEQPELETFPLFRERLVAITPRSIPYDPEKGLATLRDRPFIALTRFVSPVSHEKLEEPLGNALYRDPILAVCQRAGFTPQVTQEASDLFTVVNLVSAGLGVALVPSVANRIRVAGVNFHELHMPEAEWHIGISWNKQSEKAELIGRFFSVISKISVRAPGLKTSRHK